jgi:hypothetical protein
MRCLPVFAAAALFASAALLIPPEVVVERFLPERYASYHERLVLGLWLMKVCLLGDAIALGALSFIHGRLFPRIQPGPKVESPSPYSRADVLVILVLTCLALGLRTYRLGSGYSADEITISMSMAERPLSQLMMRAEPYRLVPALLAHFLYKLLGVSEIVGRLPSLIAGAATVPLVYILARRWSSLLCASAAGAFLALSTFHIWYSQLLTSYAIAMFFLLLSMLFFEECLRDPRARSWYWWSGGVFLAIVSHFQLALFVVFAQGVRLVWRVTTGDEPRIQLWRFLVITALCSTLATTVFAPNFLIWSRIITGLTGSSDPHFLMVEPRGTIPIQAVLFSQWLCNKFSPWPFEIVIGLAFVAGGVILGRRRPEIALYLVLPTIVFWLLFCVGAIRRITPRHSIFTLIPMSLFVGSAVSHAIELVSRRGRIGRRPMAWAGLAFCFITACLANGVLSLHHYYSVERYPLKTVASFVNSLLRSGESVVGMGYGYVELGYYLPAVEHLERPDGVGCFLDSRKPTWFVGLGSRFVRGMPTSLKERFLKETSLVCSAYGPPEQYLDLNEWFVYRYEPREKSSPTWSGSVSEIEADRIPSEILGIM